MKEVKDGKYVETGEPVERRLMRQWMLKITNYADRSAGRPDGPVNWPEGIKTMQSNWIGRFGRSRDCLCHWRARRAHQYLYNPN